MWLIVPIIACLLDFSGGLFWLAVPLLAASFQAEYYQLGFTGGAAAFGYAIFCLLSHPLSKRFGKSRLGAFGCLLALLGIVITNTANTPNELFFCALFVGSRYGLLWPVVLGWAGRTWPLGKPLLGLVLYSVAWTIGRLIGTAVCEPLFSSHQLLPFKYVFFSLLVVLVAIVWVGRHIEDGRPIAYPSLSYGVEITDEFSTLSAQIGNSLRNCVLVICIVFMPGIFEKSSFDKSLINNLFLIYAGGIPAFILGFSLFRFLPFRVILWGTKVLTGFGCLGIFFSEKGASIAFWFIFIGLLTGIAYMSSVFVSVVNQGLTIRHSARHEAGVGIGAFLGPWLGGLCAQFFNSAKATFLMAAVLALMLSFLDFRSVGKWFRSLGLTSYRI